MANRSDYNATCPRKLKRQLALMSTGDAHRDGEVKRLLLNAHATDKRIRNLRLAGKIPLVLEKTQQKDEADSEEAA